MRRLLPLLFLLVLLATTGCQGLLPPPAPPTPSDIEMATEVSKILTQMPTATQALPEATNPLPEPAVTNTPAFLTEAAMTQAVGTFVPALPTVDSTPPLPTNTPPLATPAPSSTSGAAGGPIPTVAITLVAGATTPAVTSTGPAPTSRATVAVTPLGTAIPIQPTTTPPSGDPRTLLGGATWTDNLDNGDAWAKGDDQFTSAEYEDGVMRLTAESDLDGWRLAWPKVQNFYLEMTIQPGQCSGSDHYGMIVRVPEPSKADQGYLFGLTCDGRYSLRRWNGRIGTRGEMESLIGWKTSNAIVAGANQVNRLGLLAKGDQFSLYINGVRVDQFQDDTFTAEGAFGVFIGQDETQDFTISVDQVSYWENPGL